MYKRYSVILNQLEKDGNLRKIPAIVPYNCINLSSNDYLGLNEDVSLRDEFLNGLVSRDIRLSSTSSRLLTGNCEEYGYLENLIANVYQREACLIFNSGYHANIGILPSLAGNKDLIVADKLVHASIIDGVKLSKADLMRYSHLDYEHLENILLKFRNNYDQVFIVTESIFSMDGDKTDLYRLIELKKKYNCFIYLDEAHALGVNGHIGLGCSEEYNCINDCDFIVGTFGKAMASLGAFVVCDQIVKQYLINHSRSFIFTTALPSINLAWTIFLFERLLSFKEKREKLQSLSKEFSRLMGLPYKSHIVPLIAGSNEHAIKLSAHLQSAGVYVLPIRYPTVPKGKARLRFSLNANLSPSQLKIIPETIKLYEPAVD